MVVISEEEKYFGTCRKILLIALFFDYQVAYARKLGHNISQKELFFLGKNIGWDPDGNGQPVLLIEYTVDDGKYTYNLHFMHFRITGC